MRLDDPRPEKSQVLDLRAKLQAARQAKKDCDADQSQSMGHIAEGRLTRALTRNLHIEEDDDDEDSEDWEESVDPCSVTIYCSSTQ